MPQRLQAPHSTSRSTWPKEVLSEFNRLREEVRATNGRDGLLRLEKTRPDLGIFDVMMPIMSGIEMLRAIRAGSEHRDLPVIVMSAAPQSAIVSSTKKMPAYSDYLRKPFEFNVLLAAIERLIGPGERSER